MITSAEILQALPIIASLVVIEGLLSVDNALVIAAMASHLPAHQRALALRLGIVGAYLGRGATLAIAAWIIRNQWVKIIGAGYLIYLMCAQLTAPPETEGTSSSRRNPSLFLAILQIELVDLSLSLDNVIAAVALSRKLWIVCTGVFIGILALRFIAGWCIRLVERLPILGQAAFVLVGYVGVILTIELAAGIEIGSIAKFSGILAIIAGAILYSRFALVHRLIRPFVALSQPVMRAFAKVVDWLVWPLRFLVETLVEFISRLAKSSPDA